MARKSEGTQAAVNSVNASKTANALRTIRERIDKMDLQILKLINDRAGLAVEIGRLKADHGGDVFSPAREEEVLQNVLAVNT
jgi:chorismate mutase/prephenate dehydratase